MPETLRKRGREADPLLASNDAEEPKRFHLEETDLFLHLLQLEKTLSDDDVEGCSPNEELVNRVMRSLEEEIAATCSTSHHPFNSDYNSAADNTSSSYEGQTRDSDSGDNLCYLLEASDDVLGIPQKPVLDLKDEVCQSPKETSDCLSESTDLKSLGENWHFEEDFESCQWYAVYEDARDANYMNRDFVSQGLLFDSDFSATWRLETDGSM